MARRVCPRSSRVLACDAELEWYDGPRVGLAEVNGKSHYFQNHAYDHADEADAYQVWPASEAAV